ncbi:hypothetical protein [Planomonospora parontospora]|uniref:hypothetical protein n=1 Tax=Planomonospora parontospora TaxID=58119 RepID=UPI0016707217|nr:hypothetical protein [Planomonospora parontospora]
MRRPIAGGQDEESDWSADGFSDHSPRQAVRLSAGGGACDAVLDTDRILAGPADPDRPRPSHVHEDGLHPDNAQVQALARGIGLEVVR